MAGFLLAEHEVRDFSEWRKGYLSGLPDRAAAGLTEVKVFRDTRQPQPRQHAVRRRQPRQGQSAGRIARPQGAYGKHRRRRSDERAVSQGRRLAQIGFDRSHLRVMAGLDPAIQAATLCAENRRESAPVNPPTDAVWMAGSSPAMTRAWLQSRSVNAAAPPAP